MQGLSLVAASEGHSLSRCAGLSLSRPLLLRSTGSRRAGSVIVAHGPSCSAACGIFPDQCLNPCPLHWQADSQPLHHQEALGRDLELGFKNNYKLRVWLNITTEGEEGELDLCRRHQGVWWICEPQCPGRRLSRCLGGQRILGSMHVTEGYVSPCRLEKWTAIQTNGKSTHDG